jgi:hypothetical protein
MYGQIQYSERHFFVFFLSSAIGVPLQQGSLLCRAEEALLRSLCQVLLSEVAFTLAWKKKGKWKMGDGSISVGETKRKEN